MLVVDDSRLQRRVLRAMLTRWGYEVEEAASGADALEICRDRPPCMILSDWMMPSMDGLEFCRAFRALEGDSYGYFILLTSKSDKAHVAEGLDSGADDFLTKPVNADELRARIRAGERLTAMQRRLADNNRLLSATLAELQAIHDSIDGDLIEARKLQQSLVRERFRDFGSAQVSLMLSPAGRVGGDLVGFFPAEEGRLGLFALDVAGHGISSALMTARLAGYFSAAAPDQNLALKRTRTGYAARAPDEVVAQLSRLVLEEAGGEHYLTMVLALCDLGSGVVELVQAGHPHPLIQRADGRIEPVGGGGLPVGLIEDARFDTVSLRLGPGDRLLIVSDGMIECPDADGGIVGEVRLAGMLEALATTEGPALMETLVWMLGEQGGGADFPDDISGVLFDYRGAAARI
ncbi:chemotaxis protein CheY [Oceanicola sp. 22II-s10i]|nr:chemotaxis protein CheY [Oceanicola sp. 22II-s10i]